MNDFQEQEQDAKVSVQPVGERSEASLGSVHTTSHSDSNVLDGLQATPSAERVRCEHGLGRSIQRNKRWSRIDLVGQALRSNVKVPSMDRLKLNLPSLRVKGTADSDGGDVRRLLEELGSCNQLGEQSVTALVPESQQETVPESRQKKTASTTRPRINREEANIRARQALKNPKNRSVRALAKAIGCSIGLVPKLPAWRAFEDKRKEARKLKAVSLSDGVLASTGKDDQELKRLIDEQDADFEPSPVVESNHAPVSHRRV